MTGNYPGKYRKVTTVQTEKGTYKTVDTDEWHTEDGADMREIIEVKELFDVGPVTYPAYPDTTVAARSYTVWMESNGVKTVISGETESRAEGAEVITDSFNGVPVVSIPASIDSDDLDQLRSDATKCSGESNDEPETISDERKRDIARKYKRAGRILERYKKD